MFKKPKAILVFMLTTSMVGSSSMFCRKPEMSITAHGKLLCGPMYRHKDPGAHVKLLCGVMYSPGVSGHVYREQRNLI
jgi:hypothetical protein